jgi:molecular chaperone GrpE
MRDILLDAVRSILPPPAPAPIVELKDATKDDGEPLRRAVAMLSVLESLEDLVVSLGDRTDDESRRRMAQLGRRAREMAAVVDLDEIPTSGIAVPGLHEVLDSVEDSTLPSGSIITVRQHGYTFRGRVVRPAQVVVAD